MFEAEHHTPISLDTSPRRKTYTLKQYLRKEAQSTDKHEFFNGHIVKMPYARGPHNIIAANMITQLNNAFDELERSYIVFQSDQKIYFPTLNVGAYADALAVADKPIYYDQEQLLLVNPILVVEVLSQSTGKYDRTGKFDKYKTLDSFQEYILVRQDMCYAETWYREQPDLWRETILTDRSAMLPLRSVGVEISMDRIYKHVEL